MTTPKTGRDAHGRSDRLRRFAFVFLSVAMLVTPTAALSAQPASGEPSDTTTSTVATTSTTVADTATSTVATTSTTVADTTTSTVATTSTTVADTTTSTVATTSTTVADTTTSTVATTSTTVADTATTTVVAASGFEPQEAGDPGNISGTVWDDIDADSTHDTANVLVQADGGTYGDPAVSDAGVEKGMAGVEVCLTGQITVGGNQVDVGTVNGEPRCVTTDSDGVYDFDLTDVDPDHNGTGTLTLTLTAPTKFKVSDHAGDNDFTSGTAPTPPAPWTGTASVSYTGATVEDVDAGLRPLPEITISWFDTDADHAGVQAVQTGTPDFNSLGGCQTTAPYDDPSDLHINDPLQPGDDCHKYDDVVRTNDLVNVVPSLKIENIPTGTTVKNLVMEFQFTPKKGADLRIVSPTTDGLPAGCLTGNDGDGDPYTPQSEVINNADGSIKVICNVGHSEGADAGNGALYRLVTVEPTGNSPNGSSFTTEIKAYAAGNDARSIGELTDEVRISSLPRFDLTKKRYNGETGANGGSPSNVLWLQTALLDIERSEENVTDPDTVYIPLVYDFSIMVEDDKGVSALGEEFTFEEYFDPRYLRFGAYLSGCSPSPGGYLPYDGGGVDDPGERRTADNGEVECHTDANTGTVTVTVKGADTSGFHIPTKGGYGHSLAPHKIVVTGQVTMAMTLGDLFRFAGPDKKVGTSDDGTVTDPDQLWQQGDEWLEGTYEFKNCYGDFDPDSKDADGNPVSNYGDGREPGWVDQIPGSDYKGNNCRVDGLVVERPPKPGNLRVGIRKLFLGAWFRGDDGRYSDEHLFTDPFANRRDYGWTCRPSTVLVPHQGGCDTGDGPIVGGQTFVAVNELHNFGRDHYNHPANLWQPGWCDAIDNSTYTLAPIPAGSSDHPVPSRLVGRYAYIGLKHPDSYGDDDYVIEYARFTGESKRKTWRVNHATGDLLNDFNFPLDTHEQKAAVADCGKSLVDDGQLEWTSDPDGDGWNIGDVVMVRGLSKTKDVFIPDEGKGFLYLHLKARDHFYSPDYKAEDGKPIPEGTVLPNHASGGYAQEKDDPRGWRSQGFGGGAYDPTNHTGVHFGDRLVYRNVFISIEKEAYQYWDGSKVGDDDTEQVNAGDRIMWALHPSVDSLNGEGVVRDLSITDVLPRYVEYVPGCTPPPPDGVIGPTVLPGPETGETTLMWKYLDPVPADRSPLDPISVCTSTDPFAPATPTVDVINRVEIRASEIPFREAPHTDKRTVQLVRVGRLVTKKSVDFPLDFQDQDQVWTLKWGNTSTLYKFQAPDVIDVLPWNGDGVGSLSEREINASEYAGRLELTATPEVPQVATEQNGTTGTRADEGQWYVTCKPSAEVSHDPLDASNALPGDGRWIKVAPDSAERPSRDCALADVTAVRWVSTHMLDVSDVAETSFTVKASGNDPGDLYVNRFAVYSPSFEHAVRSNERYVQVIAFSIGDLIWLDENNNGKFDEGDETAPKGVKVTLHAADGSVKGTTETDEHGRWFFEKLPKGKYYVTVDTEDLPSGWFAAPNPVKDPNTDENENMDHHAVPIPGGTLVRSAGLLELSATIDDSGNVSGGEPLGDNVASLGSSIARDDLTNFTLDLAFYMPPTGSITVTKTVDGAPAPAGWEFSVTSDVEGCVIPDGVSPKTTADGSGGTVTFTGLFTHSTTQMDEECTYTVAETAQTGWTLETAAGDLKNLSVVEDGTTQVDITNKQDTGSITVTKTTQNQRRAELPDGWEFTLTSDVDGCVVPDGTSPKTTADGTGGTVVFENLPTHSSTAADTACTYTVAETEQTGWMMTTDPAELTHLGVVGDADTPVSVVNEGVPEVSIDIEKATNGVDADTADLAPVLDKGGIVEWTYVVTNTGTDALANVTVTDDHGVIVTCEGDGDGDGDIDLMLPGASATCTGKGTAVETAGMDGGVYENVADVIGEPVYPDGTPIPGLEKPTDSDPSHYRVLPPPKPKLPRTGFDVARFAVLALVLLLAGALAVLFGRRRKNG